MPDIALPMKLLNYINGQLQEPLNGQWLDNIEPATGLVYSRIPDSTNEDLKQAIDAASAAYPAWAATDAAERSRIMLRIAQLIDENHERLAQAESQDNGKPVSLARVMDIPRAAANISFFATAILHQSTETHYNEGHSLNYTVRQPIGIVGCISPWNLPLYLFTWKIAPALAAGNTVIAKPSEITPLTAFLFSELCIQAGLPAGVLNIVHGRGGQIGQALIEHPKVKAISFTGGTATGKVIAATVAPMFKKLSLELGGKNPNIIFADCDWEDMLNTTIRSSFANQGQICLCGSRIIVERSIYERFKTDFVARVKQLRIGDPTEDVNIGAVVSEPHMNKIVGYIESARQQGANILTGGNRVQVSGRCANGYFLEPAVIDGLSVDCNLNQEEIFGPVVTIIPFDTEEEALAIANGTLYGLSATLWTQNLTRAHQMAEKLDSGIVWVNCWLVRDLRTPFGGVKQSGVGREGGWEALKFFTEAKNVCIKL
jgi:aminomuconate-semialdehyde/2-hydroxymuconate-6-semialdehyde dehydrogenase